MSRQVLVLTMGLLLQGDYRAIARAGAVNPTG